MDGLVFNIQHYSVHDGPGIRTIVFLKGCPLRCQWCSNPESQQTKQELAYNSKKCIGLTECSRCIEVCSNGAIIKAGNDKPEIDRNLCQGCLRCTDACPSKALTVFGNRMTVNEILNAVESDSVFYARSGGGLTLSGGEPLQQSEFSYQLLKAARRRRLNTTIETCGFAEWEDLEKVAGSLDSILFDIKSMNDIKHQKFTGVSNQKILTNFKKMCEKFPSLPKLVRTPVVPGFNDTKEDVLAIANFIKGLPNVRYELLAYHRLGQPKYEYLSRDYLLGSDKLSEEKFRCLRAVAKTLL